MGLGIWPYALTHSSKGVWSMGRVVWGRGTKKSGEHATPFSGSHRYCHRKGIWNGRLFYPQKNRRFVFCFGGVLVFFMCVCGGGGLCFGCFFFPLHWLLKNPSSTWKWPTQHPSSCFCAEHLSHWMSVSQKCGSYPFSCDSAPWLGRFHYYKLFYSWYLMLDILCRILVLYFYSPSKQLNQGTHL